MRLDPNWGISEDAFLMRKDLQRFIKHIVKKITEGKNPETLTCELQFYFDEKFSFLSQLPYQYRHYLMNKLSPIKIETLEKPKNASDTVKAAVVYITLASGLGNPGDMKVSTKYVVLSII